MKNSTFTSKKLSLKKIKISKINNLNNISGGGPIGGGTGSGICLTGPCIIGNTGTDTKTNPTSYVPIN